MSNIFPRDPICGAGVQVGAEGSLVENYYIHSARRVFNIQGDSFNAIFSDVQIVITY